MGIKLKNATIATVRHIGDRINKYDWIFLFGLVAVAIGYYVGNELIEGVATSVLIYGVAGTVTKNLRPDITILIADRKVKVLEENDDC